MQDICGIFNEIGDSRRSAATKHDLHEMLIIAFLRFISGGRNCREKRSPPTP